KLTKPRGPILGARDEVAPTSPPTHRRNTNKTVLRQNHDTKLHVLQRKREMETKHKASPQYTHNSHEFHRVYKRTAHAQTKCVTNQGTNILFHFFPLSNNGLLILPCLFRHVISGKSGKIKFALSFPLESRIWVFVLSCRAKVLLTTYTNFKRHPFFIN
ncbi:hypothetical protein ALC62_06689, partial [Cyphomyrmex costatus]